MTLFHPVARPQPPPPPPPPPPPTHLSMNFWKIFPLKLSQISTMYGCKGGETHKQHLRPGFSQWTYVSKSSVLFWWMNWTSCYWRSDFVRFRLVKSVCRLPFCLLLKRIHFTETTTERSRAVTGELQRRLYVRAEYQIWATLRATEIYRKF